MRTRTFSVAFEKRPAAAFSPTSGAPGAAAPGAAAPGC